MPISRSKQLTRDVTKGVTTCIICNKNQTNYQTNTFRMCEDLSVKKFLKAC